MNKTRSELFKKIYELSWPLHFPEPCGINGIMLQLNNRCNPVCKELGRPDDQQVIQEAKLAMVIALSDAQLQEPLQGSEV